MLGGGENFAEEARVRLGGGEGVVVDGVGLGGLRREVVRVFEIGLDKLGAID